METRRPKVGDEVKITEYESSFYNEIGVLIDDDGSATPFQIILKSKITAWTKSCVTVTPRPEFDFSREEPKDGIIKQQKALI
jgi:hypothetical protein